MQLPHFSGAAHIVHQVESVSFAANESHDAHLATSNMTVVYRTSTTRFNICFIPSPEFASKALPLPFASSRNVFRFVFPALREARPTELEDTRAPPNFSITFLALFHSFRASIVFITCPYTSLDALARKMLPVLVPAFCCTVFSLQLMASSASTVKG